MTSEQYAGTAHGLNPAMCFGAEHRPKMLVPIDCSQFSESILETAACTARLMQADVHLLAIVPESDHQTVKPGLSWYPTYNNDALPGAGIPDAITIERRDQALEATRQMAIDHLQTAAGRFTGLSLTSQVLLHQSIGTAIVDYARDTGIDLIVMPTHGRQRLAQALLGSVASEVVHSGVAPCLLVKPAAA